MDGNNQLDRGVSTPWMLDLDGVNVFVTCSISASSLYSTSFPAGRVTGSANKQTNPMQLALGTNPGKITYLASTNAWLGTSGDPDGPSLYIDLDNGTGRTEVINKMLVSMASNAGYTAGGLQISASQDHTTWVPLTSSVYYPGGTGMPTATYIATLNFENSTSYRYYKIRLDNDSGGTTYCGIAGIWGWDVNHFTGGGSTHGSASINLFNPNEANVTASFESENNTSLEKFTSPQRDNYGFYIDQEIGAMDLWWGDGPKLIRGWFSECYSNVGFFPAKIQFYKSDTGNYNEWELISTIDYPPHVDPMLGSQYTNYDFGTPVKTQYLRQVFYREGAGNETYNVLSYAGWMYEMVSASAPPTPTNLTTVAQNSNVALTWTQNSGSDNRLIDLIYNVERSNNAGSTYTKISTLSGSVIQTANTSSFGIPVSTHYIDTSVADGDYLYRIQAENRHHLTTGSYVTSDSITLPPPGSPKVYITNQGNVMLNPNDTTLIEI